MKRSTKWLLGLLFAVCLVGLTGKLSIAQDPLSIATPEMYKLIFENDRVRVMEVNFKVGEKIAMHSHPDHFVYVAQGGKMKLSHPDGTSADVELITGGVVWINAESHAAENIGETDVKLIVSELKEPAPVAAAAVVETPMEVPAVMEAPAEVPAEVPAEAVK